MMITQSLQRHESAPRFALVRRVREGAASAGGWVATWVTRVRQREILAGLDERMLRDIGLTRGDLRDAISEPLWRDPTAILVSRAGERRVTRSPISAVPASFVDSPSLVPTAGAGARLYVASR